MGGRDRVRREERGGMEGIQTERGRVSEREERNVRNGWENRKD
jgi:hypothetical protein